MAKINKIFLIDRNSFTRRWVCEVLKSGLHNGATCNYKDPHGGLDCGWRYEVHLSYTEEGFKREFGDE